MDQERVRGPAHGSRPPRGLLCQHVPRYIAFGWVDTDDSYPGLVSSRVAGRMRIVTNEVEEGDTELSVALERIGEILVPTLR